MLCRPVGLWDALCIVICDIGHWTSWSYGHNMSLVSMVQKEKGYTNLGIFIFVANTYRSSYFLWVVSPCLLGYPIAQQIRVLQFCAIEFKIMTCTLSPIYNCLWNYLQQKPNHNKHHNKHHNNKPTKPQQQQQQQTQQ